ncbi:MAG: ComEC/Rec2 family competence protein, partial [Pseudomonadota bacterium]
MMAPILTDETGPVLVTGQVLAVEHRQGNRLRLTVGSPRLDSRDPDISRLALAKLRLTLPITKDRALPRPGDQVQVRSILRPPPLPAYPDGYHFGRDLFFQQIGAVGFTIGSLDYQPRDAHNIADLSAWFWTRVEGVRSTVSQIINRHLERETAGVATALLTGQRGGISEPTYDDIRRAGIAHLLAISGLHLGIVAGWIFLVTRMSLALIPGLALRRPIKKYSALIALVGAGAYVLLAGAPVPTIRAFIMVAMGIGAIWLDRDPFSLRLVGVAAITVILLRPETVIGPSFQMSFAAVTGLIVAYQFFRDRGWMHQTREPIHTIPFQRFGRFVLGLMVTTIVASVATAPFALYHFQQLATFGLVGNIIGVPLATFWVLPAGMIGLLAMPLGLEALPLAVMGYGIDWVLQSAKDIAAMPWASMSTLALDGLFVLAVMVTVLLAIGRLMPMGIAGVMMAGIVFLMPVWRDTPALLVTADGDLIGITNRADHVLYVNQTRRQ